MDLNLRTETFGRGNQTWLGSQHGTDMLSPCTLDVSTFTAGTHYPLGFFPSGLALGKITTAGPDKDKYGPYDNAATDGRQDLAGFLMDDVKAPALNTMDVSGSLFQHGRVIVGNLPIPSSIDAGARADVKGAIIFV